MMDFYALLDQVVTLVQQRGRVTYRALRRQFQLDEEYLEDLKGELIKARQVARDEDGEVLVWIGDGEAPSTALSPPAQSPRSYTPAHLAARIRAEQAAMETRGATDGERKTITALFADLKGSTALIEGLDPEEARALIDPALQLMMEAVHQYEGYVAQALGDGIFALFGAPIAHEDHPQRALYAALRMQEEMRRYSAILREQGRPPLLMRVGVNTGQVVVRSIRKDDLHTDYVPIGHSTNLAARMEQLAAPGSILVTEQTHKLTAGYFEFKPLGKTQIKGVEDPLNVYEVVGAGSLRTRLQVAARRGLTRFVGRHSELEQIKRALAQAKAGHGQIVGVMGEPGVGKSRLFYEFKLTSQSGCLVLEAYSVSHGKASPYLPVIELLKTYFEISLENDERKRREKVNGKVLTLDRSLEDTLPYLFALLGIADSTSSLPQMDSQIRRRRTFDALKRLFLRESLNQPLILIFEDLHWIDSETQGVLDVLSEGVASARILLLTNYRPEYRHEWGTKTYYTQLHLAPLGKEEAEELLTFLLGDDPSLKALQHLILAKTEGTPFFMEEVVQTLAEEGAVVGERGHYRLEQVPTELHISPTVQGVLAARIDRLTTQEKELLQQLAVIGREFPLSLVRQVITQPEEETLRLLSSLRRKEFLYEQPAFPEPEYLFKHALTQEVAYTSVLQDQRKVSHERTAQAIEALYSANLEDHYSELAHHYSRSGNSHKAIQYLHLAGQQAVRRSAHAEAINHLTAALELLQSLPATPECAQQELDILIAVGVPLQTIKGWAAWEVEQTYTRARELCQQLGETAQLAAILRGLWVFYLLRAEYKTARELSEQLLSLAERLQNSALLVEAHQILGMSLFFVGEVSSALLHFEQGCTLYIPEQHRSQGFLYGWDPGVGCYIYTAVSRWILGYPNQALKSIATAHTLAKELSHPFTQVFVLNDTAWLHQMQLQPKAAQEWAEASLAIGVNQGFTDFVWSSTIHRGWALAFQGEGEEGIAQIRQGIAAGQGTGAEAMSSYNPMLLAQAYAKAGEAEEGLRRLAEAIGFASRKGERFYEAELYRLKGTLTLQQEARGWRLETGPSSPQAPSLKPQISNGAEQEAEGYFLKAIDIARQQQAKSLELRATVSLARLWQQQGKTAEARQMLAEIYHWFTEGFDTKDLQEAKALLTKLA